MFGEDRKVLSESEGLLKRHAAAELDIDIAYFRKIENNLPESRLMSYRL